MPGNSGSGIYLNTTAAAGSFIEDTYSNSNGGNGILINDVPGITMIADVTSGNGLSGVAVGNETGSLPPDISLTVSKNNRVNGFKIQNAKGAEYSENAATWTESSVTI